MKYQILFYFVILWVCLFNVVNMNLVKTINSRGDNPLWIYRHDNLLWIYRHNNQPPVGLQCLG